MSKKHFIELADVLKARYAYINEYYARSPLYQSAVLTEHEKTVNAIADFCKSQNPAFKRDRWLAYIAGECGPNGGKVTKAA